MPDQAQGGARDRWVSLVAGGVIVVIVMAALFYSGSPEPPAQGAVDTPVASADPVPAAPALAEQPAPAAPAPALQAVSAPLAPSFDTVRIEPGGAALVAGKAPAGAIVDVVVDGAVIASGTADGAGAFVALFDMPRADQPRLMTLQANLPDGSSLVSTASVAVAPTKAAEPVAIASAEPVPDPAPTEPAIAEPVATAADPEPEPVAEPAAEAAEAAPTTLLLNDQGVALMQAPSAADPLPSSAITIETIAYTPEGAVQLSGQGAGGAYLRLYLDNAELMTLPMPAKGPWQTTLPEVKPGIYTLRADQLDAEGKVLSRFETPFKRETPEALAAASGIPVPPSGVAAPPAPADIAVASASASAPLPQPVAPAQTTDASASIQLSDQPEPVAAATAEPALQDLSPPQPTAEEPAAQPAPETPTVATAQSAPSASAGPLTVTVQPGFTLWRIATEQMGDGVMYVQVYEANKDRIKDPDMIFPGQVFAIPAAN